MSTPRQSRELRVTVTNGNKGPETAAVRLQTPAGWRATPSTERIAFSREDEAITTRFMVTPPIHAAVGNVQITAEVTRDGTAGSTPPFDIGYQVIEYPHIQRRHKLIPATATVKVLDVAVAPGLNVGYIMGVGDQVPSALQQLGAKLTVIDADEMAWGDLSKFANLISLGKPSSFPATIRSPAPRRFLPWRPSVSPLPGFRLLL